MKRLLRITVKSMLLVALLVMAISSTVLAEDKSIDIVVAPNVINLESNGGSVHVHTDIGGIPNDVTLYVNGDKVDRLYLFTDSCGNLVVKCSIATVKGMVTAETDAEFVLTCNRDGDNYTGTDYVPIIDVVPQKS